MCNGIKKSYKRQIYLQIGKCIFNSYVVLHLEFPDRFATLLNSFLLLGKLQCGDTDLPKVT